MKSVKKTTKITTEGSNTFRAIARAKGKTTTKPLSLSLFHTHTQRAHSLTHSLARSFSNAFQAAADAAYTQAHTVISIRERTYYTHPQCPQLLHCALCGTDEASKAATEFP